jgi:hypothetical protein
MGSGKDGETGPKPAQTERTYTRNNVPMRTQKSDDQALQAGVLGVDQGGGGRRPQIPSMNGTA